MILHFLCFCIQVSYLDELTFIILLTEEFILEDPKNYHFLSNGMVSVPGVDDSAEYQATVDSMAIMGMTNEDLSGILTLIFILC